ncbi:hypothetical protein D187_007072 [Cystobacter fuscus DSM 2262]|uniref:Uncharacterized protein n=1 Tax=Cystobacter fuscus (strain ATCC 25194 / DSM 2262 / NBRC 100088 / M29) TaxID=1242864 RepID=S9QLE7_CYSF2|nr:hypothetical protein D187_007072 [Cystobacter fuscus DSM 2262]
MWKPTRPDCTTGRGLGGIGPGRERLFAEQAAHRADKARRATLIGGGGKRTREQGDGKP